MAVKVWTIALTEVKNDFVTPVYYYNHVQDIWERECKNGCLFLDEQSCRLKLDELNVFADIVEGTV